MKSPWDETPDPWKADEPVSTDGFSTVEAEETTSVGNVNVTTEDPIVVTVKQHGGHDAPWAVFRAKSPQEMVDLLKASVEARLLKAVSWISEEFGKTAASKPAPSFQRSSQQSAPQAAAPAPQNPVGAPHPDGRTCGPNGSHGPMKFWEGKTKQGNYAKLYFCTLDKNDPNKCRTISVA